MGFAFHELQVLGLEEDMDTLIQEAPGPVQEGAADGRRGGIGVLQGGYRRQNLCLCVP